MSLLKYWGDLYFKTKDNAENRFILKDLDFNDEDYEDVIKTDFMPIEKEKTLLEMSMFEVIDVLDKTKLKDLFSKLEELDNEGYFDFKAKGIEKKEKEAIDLMISTVNKSYTDSSQMFQDMKFLNLVKNDELAHGILTSDYVRNSFYMNQDLSVENPRAGGIYIDNLKRKLEDTRKITGSNDWDQYTPEEIEKHFSMNPEDIVKEAENVIFDVDNADPVKIMNEDMELQTLNEKRIEEEKKENVNK